jgi:glycosyltransferase involved in cell wall biosynthesis
MIFKVLQAMSFGLPVVASSEANEGIQAGDGREVLIAGSAEEFSDKLASLITDVELWQKISCGAQAFVNAKFSWDVVIADYLKNVNSEPDTITSYAAVSERMRGSGADYPP